MSRFGSLDGTVAERPGGDPPLMSAEDLTIQAGLALQESGSSVAQAQQLQTVKPMIPATLLAMRGLPRTAAMDGSAKGVVRTHHCSLSNGSTTV